MNSKKLYRGSKLFIAFISAASFSANAGTVGQCKAQANQSIKQAGEAAGADVYIEEANSQMALQSIDQTTINQGAGALQGVANANAANKMATAQRIQQLLQQCEQACQGPQDENGNRSTSDEQQQMDQAKNHCKNQLEPVIAQYGQASGDSAGAAQRSADTGAASHGSQSGGGGGGGMSPMMAGLLGAAVGAGAAMLLNKKKKDKDKEKDKAEEGTEVVDQNGNVDCAASGAEAYSDCNETYATKCLTDLSSDACKSFTNRYCTGTSTPASGLGTVATSQSGVIIASAEDKDIKGEGVGTQYCFTAQATSYCSTSGRETCPSCLQLEANKAEACAANPALCLAQNTPADIEAAKNTCPSDPLFSNPNYTAGGAGTVNNDGTLEEPILPSQYSTSQDSSGTGTGTGAGAGTETAPEVALLPEGSPAAGTNSRPDPLSTGGITIASASSGGLIGSSPSDVARGVSGNSAKVIPARAPTSVGGVMGPSLFSMSSAMIESRCKSGDLVHCAK